MWVNTEPRNAEDVMWEESGKLGEVLSSIPAKMPREAAMDTIINDIMNYKRMIAKLWKNTEFSPKAR